MKLGGNFHAVIDVKCGQFTLIKAVAKAPIPVTLRGHIVEALNTDAISTEFRLVVTDVETGEYPVCGRSVDDEKAIGKVLARSRLPA